MEKEFMIEMLKNQLAILKSDLNLRQTVLSQSGVEIVRNIAYDHYGNGKEVRRLGFDWIQSLLKRYASCEIVVINDTILTPEEEMVEDLISIIHKFSCRCYGLRKYESKFKKVVKSFEKNS